MTSLKQKYFLLNSLCGSLSIGALGLLFYVCNDGFTTLVNISAKNLTALYTTGEIRSSLWKERTNLPYSLKNKSSRESFQRSAREVSEIAKTLESKASADFKKSITEFIRIHDELLKKIEETSRKDVNLAGFREEELKAFDEFYDQGSEKLIEFRTAVVLDAEEKQGDSIRHTNSIMQVGLFGTVALTSAILLASFLYLKRYILNPLIKISAASLEVAKGDLKPVSIVETNDEIGILVANFNLMIHEIKASGEIIRAERDLAEKANFAKSAFLANMSHELRTPMHGILSFARFGQQKIDTATKERLKSYFDEIYESGSRLMGLLNDILDLSKLEAGRIEYSIQKDDLSEAIETVAAELLAFAEEKNIRIDILKNTDSFAYFDSLRMMQVVRNILSNGIKFSKAGSTIRIEIKRVADERIQCRITNRGVGIPESELESVFDKFIQSSKTKSGAGGTGLGLAICREIIHQHGGKIWAESQLGGETHFVFEFPDKSGDTLKRAA